MSDQNAAPPQQNRNIHPPLPFLPAQPRKLRSKKEIVGHLNKATEGFVCSFLSGEHVKNFRFVGEGYVLPLSRRNTTKLIDEGTLTLLPQPQGIHQRVTVYAYVHGNNALCDDFKQAVEDYRLRPAVKLQPLSAEDREYLWAGLVEHARSQGGPVRLRSFQALVQLTFQDRPDLIAHFGTGTQTSSYKSLSVFLDENSRKLSGLTKVGAGTYLYSAPVVPSALPVAAVMAEAEDAVAIEAEPEAGVGDAEPVAVAAVEEPAAAAK